MSEERLKVLEMLASGRITVEQAQQLFEVMGIEEHHRDDPADDPSDESSTENESASPKEGEARPEPRFGAFTFSEALAMGMHGVTPDDIARIRAAGLHDLSFDQMVHMSMMSVDPEFVASARRKAPELTFEQIVQLGMMGIEPTFVQQVREAGLDDLSFDEILQMGVQGVDPAFLMELRAAEQA
jgi:hypothetical protein